MSFLHFSDVMRKKPSLLVLCALLMGTPVLGLSQENPSEYASILARVKNRDLSIDFQRLRYSYMDSPERHAAKATIKESQDVIADVNRKDYKKAVQKADVVLANELVDMDAQFVEAFAHRELQETEKADVDIPFKHYLN